MTGNENNGFGFWKKTKINPYHIQSGAKREDFKEPALQKIFDAFDKDKNKILDDSEIWGIRASLSQNGVDKTINEINDEIRANLPMVVIPSDEDKITEDDLNHFLEVAQTSGSKTIITGSKKKKTNDGKEHTILRYVESDDTKVKEHTVSHAGKPTKRIIQKGKEIKEYINDPQTGELVEGQTVELSDEDYESQQNFESTLSSEELDMYDTSSVDDTLIMIGEYQKYRAEAQQIYRQSLNQRYTSRITGNGMQQSIGNKDLKLITTSDGSLWLINTKTGQLVEGKAYENALRQEAKAIADKLIDDDDNIPQCLANIKSAKLREYVDWELAKRDNDYQSKDGKTSIELYLDDECNDDTYRQHMQTLNQNSALGINGDKRMGEIIYEGLADEASGWTDDDDMEKLLNMVTANNVQYVVQKIKEKHPEYNLKANDSIAKCFREFIRDAYASDDEDRINRMVAILYKNGVIEENEEGQEAKNALMRSLLNSDDEESVRRALASMNVTSVEIDAQTINPDAPEGATETISSADYTAFTEYAKEQNGDKKPLVSGQNDIELYLTSRCQDSDGTIDFDKLKQYHDNLYKGNTPADVQAQTIILKVKQGDIKALFEATDREVYNKLEELIKAGELDSCDKFRGAKSINDCYKRAFKDSEDVNLKVRGVISGHVQLTDEEFKNLVIELMHQIDKTKGEKFSQEQANYREYMMNQNDTGELGGPRIVFTGGYDNQIEEEQLLLRQLLSLASGRPALLQEIRTLVESGNFESSKVFKFDATYDTRSSHLNAIASTNTIADEAVYLDKNGNKIDEEKHPEIKEAQTNVVTLYTNYLNQLEHTYNMLLHKEGGLSDLAEASAAYTGLGTDRTDIQHKFTEARIILNDMKAAAEGKLRDSSGKVVSVEDLMKKFDDLNIEGAFGSYTSTIAGWKTGIIVAATTLLSFGAAELAYTGAASIGLLSTSAQATGMTTSITLGTWATRGLVGLSASALTTLGTASLEYYEAASSDEGVTGGKTDQILRNLASNFAAASISYAGSVGAYALPTMSSPFWTNAARLALLLAGDTAGAMSAEVIRTGHITFGGVMYSLTFSIVGNIIALKDINVSKGAGIPLFDENHMPISDKKAVEMFDAEENIGDLKSKLNWDNLSHNEQVTNARLYILGKQHDLHQVALPIPGTNGEKMQIFSLNENQFEYYQDLLQRAHGDMSKIRGLSQEFRDELETFIIEIGRHNYGIQRSALGSQTMTLNEDALNQHSAHADLATGAYSQEIVNYRVFKAREQAAANGATKEQLREINANNLPAEFQNLVPTAEELQQYCRTAYTHGFVTLADNSSIVGGVAQRTLVIDHNGTSGLYAQAYGKYDNDGNLQEVVIAVRGSDSHQDLHDDYQMFIHGRKGTQLGELSEFYEKVRAQIGSQVPVTFAGHSLGGGLSTLMAYKYRGQNVSAYGQCAPDVFELMYNNQQEFGFATRIRDRREFAEALSSSGADITVFNNQFDEITRNGVYAGAKRYLYTQNDPTKVAHHQAMNRKLFDRNISFSVNN